jgi:trehalose 6-phosphate phosphatase
MSRFEMTAPPLPRPEAHALLLDVDGTLLDIAPSPDAVIVPEKLRESLGRLNRLLSGALALVSGRPIARLDAIFAPLRLAAAGEHGSEIRPSPGAGVERLAVRPLDPDLRRQVTEFAATLPALLIEQKSTSIAVHFRRAPELAEQVGAALRDIVARQGAALTVMPGRMLYELRGTSCNKGTAVARLLDRPPFAGRRPVYVGDDFTDEDGFAESMRRGGLALAVAGEYRASRPIAFARPADVRAWLRELATAWEAAPCPT